MEFLKELSKRTLHPLPRALDLWSWLLDTQVPCLSLALYSNLLWSVWYPTPLSHPPQNEYYTRPGTMIVGTKYYGPHTMWSPIAPKLTARPELHYTMNSWPHGSILVSLSTVLKGTGTVWMYWIGILTSNTQENCWVARVTRIQPLPSLRSDRHRK